MMSVTAGEVLHSLTNTSAVSVDGFGRHCSHVRISRISKKNKHTMILPQKTIISLKYARTCIEVVWVHEKRGMRGITDIIMLAL